MKPGYRKERIDRGIKARIDDIFAISSYREVLFLAGPRIFAIIALLALPLLKNLTGLYWQNVIFLTCIIALIALSWDLLFSVGLVSLGQAFFFGIGAYFTGALNYYLNLSPVFSIPIATFCGSTLCAILLYPVLRLRGIYFALVTFALPFFLSRIIEATKILGGTEGLSGLTPIPNITLKLYMAIIFLLIVMFCFLKLLETDYGLVLRAIKDNDISVLAAGLNVQWFKTQAVFIASIPATFGGALLTHHYQIVGMQAFAMDYSILSLTSAIVGSPGTLAGPLVGAFVLVPLSEVLRSAGTLRIVIYSLALLVFIVFLSEGIFRFAQRKYYQFERYVPLEEGKSEKSHTGN